MTNVVSPLSEMGRLTTEQAEAERLRGRPWLSAAKWGAEQFPPAQRQAAAKTTISAVPTLVASTAAVVLLLGAVSGLSPIGGGAADDRASSSSAVQKRVGAGRSAAIAATQPAPLREGSEAESAASVPAAKTATYSAATEVVAHTTVAAVANSCSASDACNHLPANVVEEAASPLLAVPLTYSNDTETESLVTVPGDTAEPRTVSSLYTAVVKDLPEGSRLSRGSQVGEREWIVALDDLGTVEISVPGTVAQRVKARVEVSSQNGAPLVRFPVIIDPKGRMEAQPIVTAALFKEDLTAPRPPKPVRAEKSAREKTAKVQKETTISPQAAKRKAPAVIKTASVPVTSPTKVSDAGEPAPETSSIGTMLEGSAGLETFRTFSLLGANPY
jgi:hypothetical protein